jgi:uncharacterized membrane protein YeaQ/YmgE (transglycosylase-associated protein family)
MSSTGFIDFLLLLVLAALVAGIGQFLTGYSRGGCPISFMAAFAGALAGPWAAEQIGWAEPFPLAVGPVEFPLVTSLAGAFVLVVLVNLLTKRRKF